MALTTTTTEKYIMTTFTLYRADIKNSDKSGSITVFDTTYYLDGDIDNWNKKEEYVLPNGWDFVDGQGERPSHLVTENNRVIDGQNICYSEMNDAPITGYIGEDGRVSVVFETVNSNA